MRLILRTSNASARLEGLTRQDRGEHDYTIWDGETVVGRIYLELIHGEPRWLWFLQTVPAPPPNQGMALTIEGAMAEFKQRYQQVSVSVLAGPRGT